MRRPSTLAGDGFRSESLPKDETTVFKQQNQSCARYTARPARRLCAQYQPEAARIDLISVQITRGDFASAHAKQEHRARGKCCRQESGAEIQRKKSRANRCEVIEYPLRANCQPKNSWNFNEPPKTTSAPRNSA